MSDAPAAITGSTLRRFKPYPLYRDSGVEWLGEVPEHWEMRRLKTIVLVNPESLPETTPTSEQILYVDVASVNQFDGIVEQSPLNFGEAPTRARRIVRDGDVIISTVRTYLRAIAAIVDPPPNLVVSTGFAAIRPTDSLIPAFAAFMLRAPHFIERVVARSVGVSFPAISPLDLACLHVPVPPLPEQHTIATFLDHETARIDALIAKQERLIALLEEKRTALITRAVTKGLDPDVPMKDSGVEWLGEVPAHWEVVPSTSLFSEGKQRALDGDQQLSATQKYGVIPQAAFERLEGRKVVHAILHLEQRKHVEVNDFVMSMRSFEGGLERVRARGCVRSSYGVLRSSVQVHTGYFSYLFKSSAYVQALRSTSNFIRDGQDLNYKNFRLVRLPLVDLREQESIAKFLDRQTTRIDAMVAKLHTAITHLREYRTAIISAAVTGKIDVRDYTLPASPSPSDATAPIDRATAHATSPTHPEPRA